MREPGSGVLSIVIIRIENLLSELNDTQLVSCSWYNYAQKKKALKNGLLVALRAIPYI